MAFNKNELILDKVRSLAAHDLADGKLLFRLTSLEDPSLATSAEGEEVTDAIGSLITTLYRAKKATFSASNSLISLDLAAAQYGTTKDIVGENNVTSITDYAYEVLAPEAVKDAQNKVTGYQVKLGLDKDGNAKITNINAANIKYIYSIEDGQIGTAYEVKSTASATEAVISDAGVVTLPYTTNTDGDILPVITGKVYVEYTYESTEAVKVTNKASNFPEACSLVIYAYFKDVCNENLTYSGKVICPKAKLNPEQVELALTSTGKHAFEFTMMRDYCAEEGDDELFSIIISK